MIASSLSPLPRLMRRAKIMTNLARLDQVIDGFVFRGVGAGQPTLGQREV